MSMESAQAFVARLKSDHEFAVNVSQFKKLDDVKVFIKNAGFDFTSEEFNSLSGELTDDDLDQVVGGKEGGGSCPGAGTPYTDDGKYLF